jgi:hypothetical protein
MRVTVALLSLLLLPVVAGCEGNEPRRSPFKVTSSPSSAKPVDYAPPVKGAAPAANPGNAVPGQPPAGNPNPANNTTITIDGDKLATRRQELNYHTAVFLRSEVGALVASGIQENNNFVFRPSEGLDKLRIIPAVSAYVGEKGKAPPTVNEFLALLQTNQIDLVELKPTEFYIYDPSLVKEANKENIDYLQQYP